MSVLSELTAGVERVCSLPAEQPGWVQRMEGLENTPELQYNMNTVNELTERCDQVRQYLQQVVDRDVRGRAVSTGPGGEQRGLQFGVGGQRHLQELGVDRPLRPA